MVLSTIYVTRHGVRPFWNKISSIFAHPIPPFRNILLTRHSFGRTGLVPHPEYTIHNACLLTRLSLGTRGASSGGAWLPRSSSEPFSLISSTQVLSTGAFKL